VNKEMVELDGLGDNDVEWLRNVLGRHFDKTGSALASRVLGNMAGESKHFVKVVPTEYRRALEAARVPATKAPAAPVVMVPARG
jgi:glutamate synthase domain-containing protein 3